MSALKAVQAGGFLAREWGSGPTKALHEKSFDMHADLAKTLEVQSYRKLPVLSVTPHELTTKMMEAAVQGGAEIVKGRVEGVVLENTDTGSKITAITVDGKEILADKVVKDSVEGGVLEDTDIGSKVTAITVDGKEILADKVVFAMGPWTTIVEDWLPGVSVPLEGIKSVSLVFADTEAVQNEPFALFCAEDANGCHLEGVYICGCGGSDYVSGDRLREDGDWGSAEKGDCGSAEKVWTDDSRVAAASASFRGLSESIGLAMTELLVDGKSSVVDLGAFDPARQHLLLSSTNAAVLQLPWTAIADMNEGKQAGFKLHPSQTAIADMNEGKQAGFKLHPSQTAIADMNEGKQAGFKLHPSQTAIADMNEGKQAGFKLSHQSFHSNRAINPRL
eukprot:gene29167-32389_t